MVQRRIRSLPDKTIPVREPPRWYPPEPDPELEYKINLPMPDLGRIIGRTQFDEANRLTEFALTAQVYLDGAWWDVARVPGPRRAGGAKAASTARRSRFT